MPKIPILLGVALTCIPGIMSTGLSRPQPPSAPNKGRISGGGAFRPAASGNFLPDRTV
jgi:hypothetical protein